MFDSSNYTVNYILHT